MEICDSIGTLNLNEGIIKEELKKHNSLANAVFHDTGLDFLDRDKIILILYKAVQELKTEIDNLKLEKPLQTR